MMLKDETARDARNPERSFLVAYRNQLARELAEVERQLVGLGGTPSRIETFER